MTTPSLNDPVCPGYSRLVLWNSLGHLRRELVHVMVDGLGVRVERPDGQRVLHQLSPVLDKTVMSNHSFYMVVFVCFIFVKMKQHRNLCILWSF